MRRFWKALVGAVVVAAAVSGVAAGVAFAQGGGEGEGRAHRDELFTRVAEKLGVSVEELKQAFEESRIELLNEAVEEGGISACRAERIQQRLADGDGPGAGRHHDRHGGRALVFYGAAETLGMSPQELKEALKSGQSLAQVAEAHGVSRDALEAGILAEAEERLGKAVDRGKLTEEQVAEAIQKLSENLDQAIDFVPCADEAPAAAEG